MASKPKFSFGKFTLPSSASQTSDHQTGNEASTSQEETEVASSESGGFGSFSWKGDAKPSTQDNDEMQRVMGFEGFKSSKKEQPTKKSAKRFDVEEMVKAIKSTRKEDSDSEEEKEEDKLDSKESDGESGEEEAPGPAPPPNYGQQHEPSSSDSENEVSDEEATEGEYFIPLANRFTLTHGERPVTALSIDPTGTRFATGSLDYEVKLWDFNALKNGHAIRALKPCESHPIKAVSYSSSGNALLVVSGSAQAKVLDRDGSELIECVKGDQYIVDMQQTKGHVASLSYGQFNPKQKNIFVTSSDDGTCRLWDVESPNRHKNCVKLKGSTGLKNRATCCCFSRDGNCFMGGGLDGTIFMWDTRKPMVVPNATMRNAHAKNTEIFSIAYSNSSLKVASRGEDSVVNIWDTRNLRKTLFKDTTKGGKYKGTNLTWSPDDTHLLIPSLPPGVDGRSKADNESNQYSSLHFLRINDFTYTKEHRFPGELAISTSWHHRLNQIAVTFASGSVSMLYDLTKSSRGALLAHGKKPSKAKVTDVVEDLSGKVIITPNSLPLFKTEKPRNTKREEIKARKDPVKSHRPDLPLALGSGGRVTTGGSTLSSYVIRNLGLSKSVKDVGDPREAILKYAKEAEENPIWVTPAYKRTQPKPIFDTKGDEEPDAKKKKVL